MKGGLAAALAAALRRCGRRRVERFDQLPHHRRRGRAAVTATIKLLGMGARQGRAFDHCILASRTSAQALAI